MQPTPPPVGAIVVQQLDFLGIVFLAMVGGAVVMMIIYAMMIKLKAHGAVVVEEWDPDGDQLARFAVVKADSFHDAKASADKLFKINTAISKKAVYWPPGLPWFLQERLNVSCHLRGQQNACAYWDTKGVINFREISDTTAMEAMAKENSRGLEVLARVSRSWLQKNKESIVIYALVAIIGVGLLVAYNTYQSNKGLKTMEEIKTFIGIANQVEAPAPIPKK